MEKYGDDRRTQIIAADGDLSMEDLIPDEDLVVTITRGGYAKRTLASNYRTQRRGGKGVRGAALRATTSSSTSWPPPTTTGCCSSPPPGRVYRTKAYNLPEASRDAKGGHVAGLLSFQPDEQIAQVLAIRDYEQAPYLVLATRAGLVKKTNLADYNSPRQAGVIAINFREEDDELIGAELVNADDDILLVSRKGQAIRFTADDDQLRPMGRATSGVRGHEVPRRRLAALDVGDPRRAGRGRGGRRGRRRGVADEVAEQYVFTITDGGFAKRTRISDYRTQSRGGLGIKAMSLANEDRGGIVGAFIVVEGDEILSITSGGQVVRSPIDEQFRADRSLDHGGAVRDAQERRQRGRRGAQRGEGRRGRGGRRGGGRGGRGRRRPPRQVRTTRATPPSDSDDARTVQQSAPRTLDDPDDTAPEEG